MNIALHIERLILDGAPVDPRQRSLLQTAFEAELTRLLTAGGLRGEIASGAELRSLPAGAIQLAPGVLPQTLGEQIAGAVYNQLGNRPAQPTTDRPGPAVNRIGLANDRRPKAPDPEG
jgi:hypothetical protein